MPHQLLAYLGTYDLPTLGWVFARYPDAYVFEPIEDED